MISVWVVLSIIMPGLFHQITSIKFSTNYMVDYLDVARDQRYEIFNMSTDTLQKELLVSFPISSICIIISPGDLIDLILEIHYGI